MIRKRSTPSVNSKREINIPLRLLAVSYDIAGVEPSNMKDLQAFPFPWRSVGR